MSVLNQSEDDAETERSIFSVDNKTEIQNEELSLKQLQLGFLMDNLSPFINVLVWMLMFYNLVTALFCTVVNITLVFKYLFTDPAWSSDYNVRLGLGKLRFQIPAPPRKLAG